MTGTGAFPPIHNIKKQSVATIAIYNYQAPCERLARRCDAPLDPPHVVNMKETVGSLVVVRSVMLRDGERSGV